MGKRDTIMVVFRIIAIFMFFLAIGILPNVLLNWSTPEMTTFSLTGKFLISLFTLGIPVGAALLLWNRSDWIADKVLEPFGMEELWSDELPDELPEDLAGEAMIEQEIIFEPEAIPIQEQTITHLTRAEIEDIVLTALAIWVLIGSIPELLQVLYRFGAMERINFGYLIIPLCKTALGVWLFFHVNDLSAWLGRWREFRMKE